MWWYHKLSKCLRSCASGCQAAPNCGSTCTCEGVRSSRIPGIASGWAGLSGRLGSGRCLGLRSRRSRFSTIMHFCLKCILICFFLRLLSRYFRIIVIFVINLMLIFIFVFILIFIFIFIFTLILIIIISNISSNVSITITITTIVIIIIDTISNNYVPKKTINIYAWFISIPLKIYTYTASLFLFW